MVRLGMDKLYLYAGDPTNPVLPPRSDFSFTQATPNPSPPSSPAPDGGSFQ